MGYIEPVSLPSGAGVNFGEHDVRHFSEGDSFSVPGISNPTRHLAARDNILAEKLNLAIAEINNKEQIIPLPVYRMVLPPSTEEIVANHRIPNGYEARVLNAVVSSTPNSADIELNVLWAEGFGNVSGSAVMTTASESSGGTTFLPAGEFVIQVNNKGGVTLDVVASVMITMRPITDTAGALLPAATVAPPGPTGAKGDKGEKGDDGGVGPAGSPGLNFRGQWVRLAYPITYQPNDVVYHNFSGTSQRSSFVCVQGHIADGINEPQPDLTPSPYWDWLAEAGETGQAGSDGAAGTNAFNSVTVVLDGTFTTGSDYIGGVTNGGYEGGGLPTTDYGLGFSQVSHEQGGHGIAYLSGSFRRIFAGSVTVVLPGLVDGAVTNWSNSTIDLVVAANGTVPVSIIDSGTYANMVYSSNNGVTGWIITVPGTTPTKINGVFSGVVSY